MIGRDTNVLVRYIMQDDSRPVTAVHTRLVESLAVESPGFVALVSVVELGWVLDAAYNLDRHQIADAFEGLLRTKEIVVERAETVWKGLPSWRRRMALCAFGCVRGGFPMQRAKRRHGLCQGRHKTDWSHSK